MIGREEQACFLEAFVEIFSRFKTQPDDEFVDVQRLMHVLQAFGRNPSLKDSQTRIQELEAAGKRKENPACLPRFSFLCQSTSS